MDCCVRRRDKQTQRPRLRKQLGWWLVIANWVLTETTNEDWNTEPRPSLIEAPTVAKRKNSKDQSRDDGEWNGWHVGIPVISFGHIG